MVRSAELGMSICSSKTMPVLVEKCGWQKMAGKKESYGSHVEKIDETC